MYVPSHFKEDDPAKLQRTIQDYGFGLLVVAEGGEIEANHVPFILESAGDGAYFLAQFGKVGRQNRRCNPNGCHRIFS